MADYCANPALQMAVADVLESYGLDATPFPASRKPPPARTFADQGRRINLGSAVLADVRREMPIGEEDRRFIYFLVDAACARLEASEPAPLPLVDRQDVKPSPMTDPSRRPDRQKPPGTAAPAKANPSRTIRSVRWSRKEARR